MSARTADRAEPELRDQAALITGGARGIGRAIALGCAAAGADVAVVDRRGGQLASVVTEIEAEGRRGLAIEADVTETARLPDLVTEVVDGLGRLDILVNNAGVMELQPALETTETVWDRHLDVNAKAAFFAARAAAEHFLSHDKPGRIVNVASTLSVRGDAGFAAYCASKGALLQVTRALAAEWAPHRIGVNAVAPTYVETEMTRQEFASHEQRARFLEGLPAREAPSPRDIAAAVVFLAGGRSRFVHGHMLPVDGGELAV